MKLPFLSATSIIVLGLAGPALAADGSVLLAQATFGSGQNVGTASGQPIGAGQNVGTASGQPIGAGQNVGTASGQPIGAGQNVGTASGKPVTQPNQ